MLQSFRPVQHFQLFQPAGVFVSFPYDFLVLPVTAYDAIHDAVHAGVHELVQCRILFQSNPSFRGVVAYLCFGGIARRLSEK